MARMHTKTCMQLVQPVYTQRLSLSLTHKLTRPGCTQRLTYTQANRTASIHTKANTYTHMKLTWPGCTQRYTYDSNSQYTHKDKKHMHTHNYVKLMQPAYTQRQMHREKRSHKAIKLHTKSETHMQRSKTYSANQLRTKMDRGETYTNTQHCVPRRLQQGSVTYT